MANNFNLVNADTDSITVCKSDGSSFTLEEQSSLLEKINKIMPDFIEWNNDGYYPSVVVVKAKNYVLFDGEKKYIKGSAFKSSNKEDALKEMMNRIVDELLNDASIDKCVEIYNDYVREAMNIIDINRWAVKKTITSTLLTSDRANETKVVDAIGDDRVQEGDKIWVYSAIGESLPVVDSDGFIEVYKKTGLPKVKENNILKQAKHWTNDENKMHYVDRCYKTIAILKTVLPIDRFIRYKLKKNQILLEKMACLEKSLGENP